MKKKKKTEKGHVVVGTLHQHQIKKLQPKNHHVIAMPSDAWEQVLDSVSEPVAELGVIEPEHLKVLQAAEEPHVIAVAPLSWWDKFWKSVKGE
jgi:hypothetical protein